MPTHKSLHIDTEALSTLALVKAGLIAPVDKLMNVKEAEEVNATQMYKGVPFPFSFILAPSGNKNQRTLSSVSKGEVIDLITEGVKVGDRKSVV